MVVGSKPKSFDLDFLVEEAVGGTFDFKGDNKGVPSQNGVLTLRVSPSLKDVPVKNITFYGTSPVCKGYLVRATIPNSDVSREGGILSSYAGLNQIEEAIQLAILDSNRDIIRTDRSTTYSSYQKQ